MTKNVVVQKFGGTSVADTDRIKKVAETVVAEKEKGNDVVVVVSAMGHTTDHLVTLAKQISDVPSPREMDMLLSTGEGISIALLTMAIQAKGYDAVSMNAMQVGIITEDLHTKARILNIETSRLKQNLNAGKIVVVAGFQGVTKDGEITTLGRGGSDTSAVAIAASLGAERCDIYTDVQGVYTSDPRMVKNATKLDTITYDEMLELANVGAGVMHPRSVETAKKYSLPLRVRSSFYTDDLGTMITGANDMELDKPVVGVAVDFTQLRVVVCDVKDEPGVAAKIFKRLAQNNITVDMIIQSYARTFNNTNDIAFTINREDKDKTMEILNEMKDEVGANEIHLDENTAKLSIVGAGMMDRPGVAATMFETLADLDVNIKMISTSEIKISCLIDGEQAEMACNKIHEAFKLNSNDIVEVNCTLPPTL